MRILGLDPGSIATGYGLVERRGGQVVHVAHGTLRPPRAGALPTVSFLHQSRCGQNSPPPSAPPAQVATLVLGRARAAAIAASGIRSRAFAATGQARCAGQRRR
jgi:hypothetical protein